MATAFDRLVERAQQSSGTPAATQFDRMLERVQRDQDTGLVDKAAQAITAQGGFDAPEVPSSIFINGRPVNIGTAIASASGNPLAVAQIVEQQTGLPVDFDPESGAPFIDIPENANVSALPDVDEDAPFLGVRSTKETIPLAGRFFINAPGLSARDVENVATESGFAAVGALPSTRAASLAGKGVAAMVGEGGASVAQDLLAQGAGSQQPINQRRAALAATLGMAGEVALPVVNRFLDAIFASPKFVKNGKVTKQGSDALRGAGIDPASVTDEFAEVFGKRARESVSPADAARFAEADTLPTPVPLTRGNVTGDVEQQGFEEAADAGAFGGRAQEVISGVRGEQREALRQNTEALAGSVDRGTGAQAAALRASEVRDEFATAVDSAYAEARSTRAFLPRDVLMSARQSYTRTLRDRGFSPEEMPTLRGRLKKFSELTKPGRSQVAMKRLEAFRQGLLGDIDTVGKRTPEGVALIALRENLDGAIEGAIDNALLVGDPRALRLYQNARGLSRMMSERFSGDAVLKKMLDPEISQRDAAQYLFGLSSLPGGKGSLSAIKRLKNILGPNSAEFAGLKAEALGRVFETARTTGPIVKGERVFSPDKLVSSVDNFLKKEHELARALFTDSERLQLRKLRNVAARTLTDRRAQNPSGTAHALARIMNASFGENRFTRIFLDRILTPLADAGRGIRAEKAVSAPLLPRSPLLPRGTGAAVGGTAARDENVETAVMPAGF